MTILSANLPPTSPRGVPVAAEIGAPDRADPLDAKPAGQVIAAVNRPGFVEARATTGSRRPGPVWFDGRSGLGFGRWDHAGGAVKASVVRPGDVVEGGELDVVETAPGPSTTDQLGLAKPDGRLGAGVVVAVAA
jgi:hypothetical protein